MINKMIMIPLLFVSSLSLAQANDTKWYGGATFGVNHTSVDEDLSVPSNKYSILDACLLSGRFRLVLCLLAL